MTFWRLLLLVIYQKSDVLKAPVFQTDAKSRNHLVIGVGSVESAFLTSATPTLMEHDHKDLPALCVLIQYLTQVWRIFVTVKFPG